MVVMAAPHGKGGHLQLGHDILRVDIWALTVPRQAGAPGVRV